MRTLASRVLAVWLGVLLLGVAGKALSAQLAVEDSGWTPSVAVDVAYCQVADPKQCFPVKRVGPGWVNCGDYTFTPAGRPNQTPGVAYACYTVDATPPAPPPATTATPIVVCEIDWSLDILSRVVLHRPLPSNLVTADATHYALWPCEGKRVQGQVYTLAQAGALVAAGVTDRAGANTYAAGQPVQPYTAGQKAFLLERAADHAALLWPPVVTPTAPRAVVSPGAADRPVYRLKADGSRNTTAVSGIRVANPTPCNPDKRPVVNPGSYMSVQGELSTTGVRITEDLYASCSVVQ